MRERGAVVTGEDDERVGREAAFGEKIEDGLHAAVHAMDLATVVGELLAHPREIGPVRGEFQQRGIGAVAGGGALSQSGFLK